MPAFPKRTTTDFSNLASGNLIGYLMVPDPEFPRTPSFQRRPQPSKALTGSDRTKVKVMGRESILINKSLTDLRAVEQLTDSEQLNGLAALLLDAAERRMDGTKTLVQVVDLLERQMDEKGLASLLAPGRPGDLARPRRQEIFECLDRCRELKF